MANRQRAEARRKAQSKISYGGGGEGGGSKLMIWLALAVVVLLAGGIAFFATKDDKTASAPPATDQAGNNIPVSQPVTITGDALVPFDSAATADAAVGVVAPILSGLNFQSSAIKMDPATEGPYMLVFLAHWCPHCNAEVPRLLDWKNSGGAPAELNVIGVATAVSASAPNYPPSSWFSTKGWSWPVLVDESRGDGVAGKAAAAYGASGWPYFVIVGADGKVKARVSGEVEISTLQSIVDSALAS